MNDTRILWIGAHPDDELFIAPWLGSLYESGAACGFFVATRGERGPCYRDEGCEPDLATVREAEMRDAAAVFGGEVWFGDCRDGSGATAELVLDAWAVEAGGSTSLRQRFLGAIEQFAPDLIVTFDARHGSTEHPDHRAIGMLVEQLALEVPLRRVESRLSWRHPLRVTSADPAAEEIDVRRWWDYLLRDLACHRSQMSPRALEMFRNAPDEQRKIYLL